MIISPFAEIPDFEFEEILIRLYAFTERKMYHFRGTRIYSLADYEDIANEAVIKTLSNERPWNKDKCPDLFAHLAGCSKSMIFNLKESQQIIKHDTWDVGLHIDNKEVSQEEMADSIQKIEHFIQYVSENRKDLLRLTEAMLKKEIIKPQELSAHLGISVKEVNVMKVALKRLANRVRKGGAL